MRRFLFLVGYLSWAMVTASGQEAGLFFVSYENVQDDRTGINLTANGDICFDSQLSLSIDVRFRPNQTSYYGYIFRIILGQGHNI